MFQIPRVNVIESDEGFSVEVLGRTGLRYSEGNRWLRIDSEVLDGPSGIVLYSRSIKEWDGPTPGEPIEMAVKARIIENVRAAFKFRGLNIEVE